MDAVQIEEMLAEIRRRRSELRRSMARLEQAVAAPARAGWHAGVRDALEELSDDLVEHIAATESPDGLYTQVLHDAPRLAGRVHRLTEEHREMSDRVAHLIKQCDAAQAGTDSDVDLVRGEATDLLVRIAHHRQRGSDLLFDAYESDVGGET